MAGLAAQSPYDSLDWLSGRKIVCAQDLLGNCARSTVNIYRSNDRNIAIVNATA